MGFFEVALLSATFLCALVAGFLFAFAVVIMPGIRRLEDRQFIRAFQVMDGVIQRNQPLFMAVWLGSVVALVAAVFGVGQLDTFGRTLLIAATAAYLLGVQLPTIVFNVPLNNGLQALDAGASDGKGLAAAREAFEARWNRWNRMRTVVACLVTLLLLVLLFRY